MDKFSHRLGLQELISNFTCCLSIEIRKALSNIAKLKDCEALWEWIKPCERHLYWSATSTFNGDGKLIWDKFRTFLNHVINKHSGFKDTSFNKCSHGNLEPRKWLKAGTCMFTHSYTVVVI